MGAAAAFAVPMLRQELDIRQGNFKSCNTSVRYSGTEDKVMVTPAAGASIDSTTTLALALAGESTLQSRSYQENPIGVFRGLAYAMVFYAC